MLHLLHEENFDRILVFGQRMKLDLAVRAGEVALANFRVADPRVSIVIRTRNNVAQLDGLLDDIEEQEFSGEREVVVVDTESTDGTRSLACRRGATVVAITQDDFSYPKALNRGFVAASHPYIFSFVDHSALSNTQTLRTATRWYRTPDFAGAYGTALPNANASRTERIGAVALGVSAILNNAAHRVLEPGMGVLAANCSVVARSAWAEAWGYDEAYGSGGEDGDLGKRILADGGVLMLEPALSVFHTHGLGPINGFRQLRAWRQMGKPHDFNRGELERYRPDLP